MAFTLALISDLHFGPEARFQGKLRKLTSQAAALTEAFVREMNERVHPDAIVNLGDDIEDQDAASDRANYLQCQQILRSAHCPVLHVAGNHDAIHLKLRDLVEIWGRTGKPYYATEIGPLRAIVLHTVERRDTEVHLPAEQIDWLRDELAHSNRPALVFMHHPASDQRLEDSRWFAAAPHLALVNNRGDLRAVLEASGVVAGVFNGHVHRNHCDVIRGIPYITLQSLIENLDDDAPGRVSGSYAVVEISRERMIVRVRGNDPARYQFDGLAPLRGLADA